MVREICERTGKVCYCSRREAGGVVNWFFKRRNHHPHGNKIPSRVFLCKFCGKYHLTHFRRSRKERRKMGRKI